ncbi:MAG: hypothetical protein SFV21_11090, partial [Rhodospirillaceae bacterium]|nr:hypothetical protein [Rhodospirillaceae bacterium]
MRALVLTFLILVSGAGRADDAATTREVTAVVEAMAARWTAGERQTIVADFWDAEDPGVMYLAGEQPDWFVGAPAIAAYLGPRPNAPPSISSFAVSNIRVRPVAADVALAAWELDYQFQRGA